MKYPDQYIEKCLEDQNSILNCLAQRDKDLVAEHYSITRIRKGRSIFNEGDKFRGLIFMASGKAKIFRNGVAGREHIMRLIKPGDLMGLGVLFSDNVWPANSVALEDSVTCSVDRQVIMKLFRSNAELAMRAGRLLACELYSSYNKMVSLTQKHVRGRLAESILLAAETYGLEDDGKTLRSRLSRNDLAHLSNMTTSNAIRTLSSFASEGIIKLKGRQLTLLDEALLEKISEQA